MFTAKRGKKQNLPATQYKIVAWQMSNIMFGSSNMLKSKVFYIKIKTLLEIELHRYKSTS